MIEQIKQDLAEWDELVAKRPELKGRCGKWPEWVRSLIGEVERLEFERNEAVSSHRFWSGAWKEVKGQVEELRKALEWYADERTYEPYPVDGKFDSDANWDRGYRARKALQLLKGE